MDTKELSDTRFFLVWALYLMREGVDDDIVQFFMRCGGSQIGL